MSALEFFVSQNLFWAYAILFGGMFIEGEIFFLGAALFAWQGHLEWFLVIVVAFIGVILGDIVWYFLGKYLDRIPFFGFLLRIKFSVYHEWLDENFIKRYSRMAFFSKFLYYFNRLTPLIAGWQKFEFKKFLKIHFFAGVLWIAVMSTLSYLLGFVVGPNGLKWLLSRFEFVVIGLIAVFIGGEYLLKRIFTSRIKKELSQQSQQF